MRASFIVPFEDFDYEGWAGQLGLEANFVPVKPGQWRLTVWGDAESIDQFEAELSWDREE